MFNQQSSNVHKHEGVVSRKDRSGLLGHNNKVLWFTGLSGSGKSTIARSVEKTLHDKGVMTYVLDGDNIRQGLNGDLGFSASDRVENIRRIGEVTKLFHDAGVMVLVCFISPYTESRTQVRSLIGEDFVEVHVDCSVAGCEQRDVKGLYKKARSGEIADFTGVSAPYEKPENAELVLDTESLSVDDCAQKVIEYLGL